MSLLLCKRTRSRTPQGKECVQGKPLPGFWIWMAAPSGASQAFCRRQNLGAGGIHFRRACQIPLGWSGQRPRMQALPHTARKGMCARETFAGFPLHVQSKAAAGGPDFCFAKISSPIARTNKTTPKGWFCWCERWDLNPHDLTNTGTSSLPVCLFQHARGQNTHLL